MLGTTRIESSANIVNTTNNLPTNTNNQSKDNSFLRWINPFNSNNNNNNSNSNPTNIINDSNINCRGSTPNLDNKKILNDNNTNSNEYRGVEGLKQFWNNRISSTKLDTKDKIKSLGNQKSEDSNNCNKNNSINSSLTSSKSYGCLISSHYSFDNSNNKNNCDNSIIVENLLRYPSSSSSYCSSIEQEGYRKSDNFYKYKTAATKKPLSLDLTKNIVITTSTTNQINNNNNNEIDIIRNCNETNRKLNKLNGINFPLIASTPKGEKIHWARREDIFVNRKQKPQVENTIYDTVRKKLNSVQINNNNNKNKININNVENNKILDEKIINIKLPKTIRKDNINNNNNNNIVDNKISTDEKVDKTDNNNAITTTTTTTTVMAIKSSDKIIQNHQTINTTSTNMAIPMLKKDNIIDKTDKYNSKNTLSILSDDRSSINSSTNSLISPTSTDPTNIRKKNNSAAVRKYSFKTHATKNLYTPRKMTNHHHHHHQIVGSKVAALTMQFNQMVEKDSAILDEVKRKNGIIMARSSGHVYKIKEETDSNSKRKTLLISSLGKPSSESEEGSIKSMKINKKKIISRKLKNSSDGTVRATIRKFEGSPINHNINQIIINELDTKEIKAKEKPQVPQKSEHVLKRTKDLQLRNIQKKPKPTTIEIHMEEIKEEIKIPITETKEILIESEVIPCKTLTYADIQQSVPEQSIKTLPDEISNKDSEEDVISEHDSEESPSKKSRYARIYEKFRFRSTFFTNKKLQENRDPNLEKSSSPSSPDKKIKDTIESGNVKLEHLSKSENDVSLDIKDKENFVCDTKMQANESFLFRTNSKKITTPYVQIQVPAPQNQENPQLPLVEAINTRIINKTQSMDEIRFPSLQIRNLSLDESMNYTKTNNKYHDEDDELYEPIDVNKTENIAPQKSFLFHRLVSKSQINDTVLATDDDSNNIYQTIADAKLEQQLLENKLRIIENLEDDADCYENYESVPDDHLQHQTEDGYEICDPQSVDQKHHPRVSDIQRNTTDELPALPEPKRIIQHNKNLIIGNIQPPPPRPKKLTESRTKKLPDIPITIVNNKSSNVGNVNDVDDDEDENIYDTIKGSELTSNCYEFLNNNSKNSPKSLDTVSLISNCYETISSVRRGLTNIRNSDSISTTSSDHKTNSLYGMQMNGGNNSIHNTDGSSDNNSDDWIDISDGDDEGMKYTKQQFVVVRERTKCHRSPDWSKRVRDQRIHQQSQNYFDDDSDHYYEPLFPSSVDKTSQIPTVEALNGELVNKLIISSDNNGKTYQKTINKTSATQGNHHHHHHHHHHSAYSDDYDSFDTDDETDEEVKKNDSGVDISNAKLPEPPQTSNQVYALVKKFKNFISNKKISTSPKSDNNSGKQYENTQFYVSPNEYQNTKYLDKKLTKKKTPKLTKKLISRDSDDPYENTEFHAPIVPKLQPVEPINISSPTQSPTNTTISSQTIDQTIIDKPDLINRRKSKSEKSFKSKLRKSLTGNSHHNSTDITNTLNSTRSTFYISDSVDLDSGIFEKTNNIIQPLVGQTIVTDEINIKQTEIHQPENTSDRPIPVTRKSKRNLRSPDLNRRRTTIGIRPNNPPPPPPTDKKPATLQKQRSTTSWYAECGVFKANGIGGGGGVGGDELKESRRDRNSNSSWYAEAGLYQTSGASVASSSGSSGVSTGGEGCPGDDNNSHSMFLNEPLYQIYSAAKLESISRDMEDQDSTDGYEEIGGGHIKRAQRPSALQLVGPKQGPSRTLWSEIPEVINSEILSTLTPTEKRLQEAKFEVLTSEASYLKSLNLLRTHFMNNADFRDPSILKPTDRKTLFAHIIPVYECSDRLLSDLERCWQDNIMLLGLSKSIYKNAEKYFNVYISFCEHQGKMDRTLRRLKEQKGEFSQKLDILEHDSACCGLNLHSFLMLPMQRITRLPLLIDAVFSKVKGDDDEYENWKMTLSILNKIVLQCNEAANRCEQSYEIEKISRQIEFPSNIRSIAIAPVGVPVSGAKPRALVKKGELVHFIWRGDDAKLTFGKKFSKSNIYAFLFTDLLILSKKKSDEQFIVFDYCQRSMLTISSGDVIPQLPTKDIHQAGKNLILMTLLENHEGKTIEMILSCPSVSDQQRWLEATAPREPEQPGEKLYEQWDCPQVIAKHEYLATEPDLLSLEPGDVVNVTRKLPDGWYQGERIRDGVCGWFPGSFTEEVNSAHVRARNLKQRYRLLTFTASYLEMQKRK